MIRLTAMAPPPIVSMPRLVRMSAAEIAELIEGRPPDAGFFMNQYQIFSTLGNRGFALAMQEKALALSTAFRIDAVRNPAIRLLALMTPGDSSDNTPIEYLTENSDIQLDLLYILPGMPLPEAIPEHDVAIVAAGKRSSLDEMEEIIANWPRPVLNPVDGIRRCAREILWQILRDIPGLEIAPTTIESRQSLTANYPMTIRPLDSQAGQGLSRIEDAEDLKEYLTKSDAEFFHVSRFIDCRSRDGRYRKIRIVLIDGEPHVCHLAINEHWIVHYGTSNMGMSAEKRCEEAGFMKRFEGEFLPRHRGALNEISRRTGLDYVVIDCAETDDKKLLVFEADNRGWVHATDPMDLFPYKQEHMEKVFSAFRSMLIRAMRQTAIR